MDLDSKRDVTPRTGVVSGSVWESRIKGGINVFKGDETPEDHIDNNCDTEIQVPKRMSPKHGVSGKRKTWKTEISEEPDKNPIQIACQISELMKNSDEECKELSGHVDEIKKTPVQIPRQRSKWSKNLDEPLKGLSVADIKKSPIHSMKTRSQVNKELNLSAADRIERSPRSLRTRLVSRKGVSESIVANQMNSIQLRKGNFESNKDSNECSDTNKSNAGSVLDNSNEKFTASDYTNGRKLVKFRISNELVDDDSRKSFDGSVEGVKKSPFEISKTRSDENTKEMRKSEDSIGTSNLSNVRQVKSPPNLQLTYGDGNEYGDNYYDGESDEDNNAIESEKKSSGVKEISVPELKAKKIVVEEKKIRQIKSIPIELVAKRQPPPHVLNNPRIVLKPTKTKPVPYLDEFRMEPNKHSKLQSFVDLVMWRDPSKSAFIFGLGMFLIISTSYTTDINISLISVLSYAGLVYLAAIFLFRSLFCRTALDVDDTNEEYVLGEEEAVWLLKLILPYINEFLSKIKALFSGDPATTMKLAVLLFVLARCGSYITIWKMVKFGFFGVFTIPKICSSYSSQLSAHGKFWIHRFRDAWESCSHKKGVGFFIFTLIWNLSSVVARIWAVFMLFVAFRYYQQKQQQQQQQHFGEWTEGESAVEVKNGRQKTQGNGPVLLDIKKMKTVS